MANMHVRATLRKSRVLTYLIWSLEENAANSVYLCVLRVHFNPVKCSIRGIHSMTPYTHFRVYIYKMPRVHTSRGARVQKCQK